MDCPGIHAPLVLADGGRSVRRSLVGDQSSVRFGRLSVDPAMVRLVLGVSLAFLFFVIVQFISFVGKSPAASSVGSRLQPQISTIKASSVAVLLAQLRENSLWDLEASVEIPPVLLSELPGDFHTLDRVTQKRAFLHTLLPVAMIAAAEVENERQALEEIFVRLVVLPKRLDFRSGKTADGRLLAGLSAEERQFLQHLSGKYRTKDIVTLRSKVAPVPVSLLMAQAGLESSWGGSRFALRHNNLFGVLSWGAGGIVPEGREDGLGYRAVSYGSLLEGVRSYMLMLNRQPAYARFREIRRQTGDSLALVDGLRSYSERKKDYTDDLAKLIRTNRLQQFDNYVLAGSGQSQRPIRMAAIF